MLQFVPQIALPGAECNTVVYEPVTVQRKVLLEPWSSAKIGEVTLMRPIHGNL